MKLCLNATCATESLKERTIYINTEVPESQENSPFTCNVCDTKFCFNFNSKEDKITHENAKKLKCENCKGHNTYTPTQTARKLRKLPFHVQCVCIRF